jgi:hypothetical protein
LKISAVATGATNNTEKRMHADFNMAIFLALSLDFRKADLAVAPAKKLLRDQGSSC